MSANNGVAALETLDRGGPVDLLLTDVVMPGGLNGRQLADKAVARRPGLRVLYMTGYTRNAIVHHGRLDPGINMVSKPFSFEELAARVRERLIPRTETRPSARTQRFGLRPVTIIGVLGE